MSKKHPTAAAELRAVLLGLALYAGAQLGLALLAEREILPEGALPAAQAVSCGVCVFAAGWLAARKTSLGALCAALIAAGSFAGMLLLCSLNSSNGFSAQREGVLLAACGIGGVLSGLLGGAGRRKRRGGRRIQPTAKEHTRRRQHREFPQK